LGSVEGASALAEGPPLLSDGSKSISIGAGCGSSGGGVCGSVTSMATINATCSAPDV
jgi:hypothetical protein